jgi:hypothetical protein
MNFRTNHAALAAAFTLALACGAIGAGCGEDDVAVDQPDASSSSSSSSSGSSSGGSSSSSGGSSSSSSGDVDASTVIPDGVLEVHVGGGFGPAVTDASACQPADSTYTYDRTTRDLSWKLCEPVPGPADAGAVYAYDTGTRVLTVDEAGPIAAAVANIHDAAAHPDDCPLDAPSTTLRVLAPNDGVTSFHDACEFVADSGFHYVTGLGDLRDALANDAQEIH